MVRVTVTVEPGPAESGRSLLTLTGAAAPDMVIPESPVINGFVSPP